MRRLATFSALLLVVATAASAQSARVTANAPIYVTPNPAGAQVPLRVAAPGTVLKVMKEEGEWVQVQFQDPQGGRRTGWLKRDLITIERPELRPMDLSVPLEPSRPAVETGVNLRAPQPAITSSRAFERGWIDVNLGVSFPTLKERTVDYDFVVFREPALVSAQYHYVTGADFDFGGGIMFVPQFGVGVSIVGVANQHAADLTARIPHPLVANAYATDTSETDAKLLHADGSVNIQAMFVQQLSPRTRVRLFGGPSWFRAQPELVEEIGWSQLWTVVPTTNTIVVDRFSSDKYDDITGWGFHVGADVSWFFTRVVGIGGFVRYLRGDLTYTDPLSGADEQLRVGGVQLGGGLRLKF